MEASAKRSAAAPWTPRPRRTVDLVVVDMPPAVEDGPPSRRPNVADLVV